MITIQPSMRWVLAIACFSCTATSNSISTRAEPAGETTKFSHHLPSKTIWFSWPLFTDQLFGRTRFGGFYFIVSYTIVTYPYDMWLWSKVAIHTAFWHATWWSEWCILCTAAYVWLSGQCFSCCGVASFMTGNQLMFIAAIFASPLLSLCMKKYSM